MLKNCKANSSKERLISCWLCDNVSHLGCAGFNGRHYDVICDRNKGLRWSCWDCRQLDIDFYKLFKEAKSGVTEFRKIFEAMSEKLSKFEELFENFDFSVCSPKRKKSSLTASDNVKSHNITVDKNLISLLSPVVGSIEPRPENCNPAFPVIQGISGADTSNVITPTLSQNSNVGNVNSISVASCVISGADTGNDITPTLPQNSYADTVNSISVAPNVICTRVEPVPTTDLVVVPPRKTIFLSRLSPDTSIDHIRSYVKSKCTGILDKEFSILKFNFSQPRDIASFRIYIPARMFETLVDKSFWPEGALVREFVHRDRGRSDVAKLPPRIVIPKN